MRHIKSKEMLQLTREEHIVLDKCRDLMRDLFDNLQMKGVKYKCE